MTNDARNFFEEVAENTLEWEHVSVNDKQSTTITSTNTGGMHNVNSKSESDAKMISLVWRLEALEMTKGV